MRRVVGAMVFFVFALAWTTARASESFAIHTFPGGPAAEDVLRECCALRQQIEQKWLRTTGQEPWTPSCDVVLHSGYASYVQAVGKAAARTSGSSLVRYDGRTIVHRRIDLLVDNSGRLNALAHELTHLVVAERFLRSQNRHAPKWAEEGMATLVDSSTKKSLHQRDCFLALRNGTSMRLAELLELEHFSSTHQVAAFYGQSLSLVQFLVERHEPHQFVFFLETAAESGYDQALRQCYRIDNVAQLEALWLADCCSRFSG